MENHSQKPAAINTATTPNLDPLTSDPDAVTLSLHSDLDFDSDTDTDPYSDYDYDSDLYSNYDYDSDFYVDWDFDFELDPLPLHTTTTRYLRGRPATANPNPRGKHHRNPLPWSKRKLAMVTGYEDDAAAYYRHLWREQQEQKQLDKANNTNTTTRRNTTLQPPNPKPNPKTNAKTKTNPITNPKTRTKTKTKKQHAKFKPKIPNPHFLNYLAANARRHRPWLRWGCPCCVDLTRVLTLRERRRAWPGLREEGVAMARERDWNGVAIPIPGEERFGWGGGWKGVGMEGRGLRVVKVGGGEEEGDGVLRGEGGYGGGEDVEEEEEVVVMDGEYEVAAGFGLGDIVRHEPVYSVTFKYSQGPARKAKGGDICEDAGSVGDERLVEEVNSDEEWEMEWDFVDGCRRRDGERDGDDLGSEWTGVDMGGVRVCSQVGTDEDQWEVLSDSKDWDK